MDTSGLIILAPRMCIYYRPPGAAATRYADMSGILAIVSPLTPNSSTCGYCGPPGKRSAGNTSIHAAELIPTDCSCMAYQMMIDRGWRRSGTYCYKPDLMRSCCPQYTIRLDAIQFKASKSQRKLVNRFNRWVYHGDSDDNDKPAKQRAAASKEGGFSLIHAISSAEYRVCAAEQPAHKFEVALEPSSFTREKLELYQKYQRDIHKEEELKKPSSFERFLVDNPLQREAISYAKEPPDHLPKEYGAYHQLYRLDGELVALGVIDILPSCVSSVYFMYDKKWERFSLGKLSALRETALAQEMHAAGAPGMQYLYMGFYIHSCPKMRYKGDYAPSYLLDPEEYTWHPLEGCKAMLDRVRYASFAHPEHNIEGAYEGPAPQPTLPPDMLEDLLLFVPGRGGNHAVKRVSTSSDWKNPATKLAITTVALGLGKELANRVIFYLAYVL